MCQAAAAAGAAAPRSMLACLSISSNAALTVVSTLCAHACGSERAPASESFLSFTSGALHAHSGVAGSAWAVGQSRIGFVSAPEHADVTSLVAARELVLDFVLRSSAVVPSFLDSSSARVSLLVEAANLCVVLIDELCDVYVIEVVNGVAQVNALDPGVYSIIDGVFDADDENHSNTKLSFMGMLEAQARDVQSQDARAMELGRACHLAGSGGVVVFREPAVAPCSAFMLAPDLGAAVPVLLRGAAAFPDADADPHRPRGFRTAYNFFASTRAEKDARVVSRLWNELSAQDRAPFEDSADEDRVRFWNDYVEYAPHPGFARQATRVRPPPGFAHDANRQQPYGIFAGVMHRRMLGVELGERNRRTAELWRAMTADERAAYRVASEQ